MKDQNRHRIERLTARYATRLRAELIPEEAEFLREFDEVRARVLKPLMDEFAAELCKAGHDARVLLDVSRSEARPGASEGGDMEGGADLPSITLSLGLRGGKGTRNIVVFSVIRWTNYPLQILAYLEVNPLPFDLERFAHASDVTADRVEQMLTDAIEHIIVCNAP